MTIKEALELGTKKLKKTESPHLDVEVLLSFITKKSRVYLLTYPLKKLTKEQIKKYKKLIERRVKNEPVAYIIGYKEFYNLKFLVNENTLIPRPETELLIDAVKEYITSYSFLRKQESQLSFLRKQKSQKTAIIDIGLGCGTIAITLKKLFPHTTVFATETNIPTISLAKKNAKNLKTKIIIKKGNLLTPLKKEFKKYSNDLIITANLPYLSEKEWEKTKPNVRLYEPKNALIGGKNGLELYEKLFKQIKKEITNLKNYNIKIFLEMGYLQKNKITELARKYLNTKKIKFYKDLSDKWRVCSINLQKSVCHTGNQSVILDLIQYPE